MRYVMSDIHGEYELFLALLDKIGFSVDECKAYYVERSELK